MKSAALLYLDMTHSVGGCELRLEGNSSGTGPPNVELIWACSKFAIVAIARPQRAAELFSNIVPLSSSTRPRTFINSWSLSCGPSTHRPPAQYGAAAGCVSGQPAAAAAGGCSMHAA